MTIKRRMMAKTKAKAVKATAEQVSPPAVAPAAEATATSPHALAAEFKAAVAQVEQEQNIQLRPTRATVAGAVPAGVQVPPPPQWSAEGVGKAGAHLVNAFLVAGEFEELEQDESKTFAEALAYYLSARWPSGSAWEPELRLGVAGVEILAPRLIARAKARRDAALEKEAEEIGSQGERST